MRTQKEMMQLILNFAEDDDRIRVVGMNGSRVNPQIIGDRFQDYDIVYLVTEMNSFIKNREWLDYFGERLIMQTPEDSELFPPSLGNWFSFLMQFTDGNRIDLMLVPIEELDQYMKNDSLTTILLDKDKRINNKPIPTEESHYLQIPTENQYLDACNEFWWVSTYVTKGLCRKEFLYAIDHIENVMQEEILRMMAWKVGCQYGFRVNLGKSYKFLEEYVSETEWKALQQMYNLSTYDDCWRVLFHMFAMYKELVVFVADSLQFQLPDYQHKVESYVRQLYDDGNRS
ncbi:aminoglycoside 6-adenylyltransferase [Gracilibacillus kekensis]|uniref:Aminoglycoside 6-adenylyltransferase n=1 Tax=Gracilibacillus kekensis TaxID=1027249 RepID=A0A1M7QBH4_9BACI|nr:aminoglycoside 6-adenylyltransferase [Gracilibacillus kekensis]SHN27844.1 aminoglycoside 6-adenylyltransferase [Gracilibacillus kekensis]